MDSINCIFCCQTSNPTNEHVVPEFLGGGLIIQDVCNTCNSKMGHDFEGPLSKSILFRLPRHIHNIQGKSSTPVNAFPNTGQTESGSKIRIDSNFKPYTITKTVETKAANGDITVNLTVDASDKDKIPEIIETKIRRMLKKENPEITKEEIDNIVNRSLTSLPTDYKIETHQPTIKYNESIDLNHLTFLMMKIAYEITFFHHGSAILSDKTNIILRQAIFKRNKKASLNGTLYPKPDPFLNIPIQNSSHCLILYRNFCYVRLFDNITAIVQVCDEQSSFFLSEASWEIYWFNYINKTWRKDNFLKSLFK